MNLTASSLKNPAGIAVAVAVILFFGAYSLTRLPVQLFPDIENPTISIQTGWRAASPREIESEIVEPIEAVLRGIPGLKEMAAYANAGNAWVNLEFGLNTDMQRTLIEVISRMNRLDPLPRDATQPVIMLGGGNGDTPALTFFFLQLLPGTEGSIYDYIQFVEDVIRPAIESVPGVARVSVQQNNANPEQELEILFDPYRAAQLGIPLTETAARLGRANDISGGFVDVGRRQYTLRFTGRYEPDELSGFVLEWRDGRPIKLGDIADIAVTRGEQVLTNTQNGNPAVAVRIDKETSANALQTLNAVKAVVAELNAGPVADRGLVMAQSFDASVFIIRAIGLVGGNILLGILLAVGILWWFLRRFRATLIVAVAIPVSLLATFVVLNLTGRTLNVISLAGLAFAVGMVLDAAIVVLENVVRLREKGLNSFDASLQGAQQVWGALLASTATTVAIFLPVIFMREVEGQLFGDLAITIAIAVVVSLLVAVTILPLAARRWLQEGKLEDRNRGLWLRISNFIMAITSTPRKRWTLAAVLIATPLSASYLLLPELDYLPPVKRDAVDAYFQFPPGVSERSIAEEYIKVLDERMAPFMSGEREPALKNYYILTWNGGGGMGARVADQSRVKELERIINQEIFADLPDMQFFASQGNLFGGFGGDRVIALHLQSRDRAAIAEAAALGETLLREALPDSNVRVSPNLEQAEPELQLAPNDRKIAEAGWARQDIGTLVRAMGDGLYVGEYFNGEKRMNIILRSEPWESPEQLASAPVVTPTGALVPLSELVDIERTVGPSQLRRIDSRRTITIDVRPPEDVSLEHVLTTIRQQVEPRLKAALPADGNILYGGSANALTRAIKSMGNNFALALVVLFLLMAALFRSMKDSLLVVMAMPLAMVGGIVAIRLLNLVSFQPLDLLTMIGFVILLGLVVNNAILLVHQTRSAEREGVSRHQAVEQALQTRLRPIFMSTLTSIFGMLPLLLMPGAGSVIYRGLAAVIVGGMCVSTLFTLLLLPCFLRMGESHSRVIEGDGDKTPAPQLKSVA
ncbi:efflux RND transporter permease subunit [Seongchinamella sediminis]|uniref:Efflux RND transporter permease subunit n=1 Tax=Seongchinamella sediminis TaxID=2283635 RepID=A0A3L7E4S1_9GAMM|nr:efflux RND transporter permease subunit [Seongchinamella sediminis]RLQ23551.1 efflux RND transporter permease subunit [Seongchinamella sediminis]